MSTSAHARMHPGCDETQFGARAKFECECRQTLRPSRRHSLQGSRRLRHSIQLTAKHCRYHTNETSSSAASVDSFLGFVQRRHIIFVVVVAVVMVRITLGFDAMMINSLIVTSINSFIRSIVSRESSFS